MKTTLDTLLDRISDWMRVYAPIVKRRADRGEEAFCQVRNTYQAVQEDQSSEEKAQACLTSIQAVQPILDALPTDAFLYLSHVGDYHA